MLDHYITTINIPLYYSLKKNKNLPITAALLNPVFMTIHQLLVSIIYVLFIFLSVCLFVFLHKPSSWWRPTPLGVK